VDYGPSHLSGRRRFHLEKFRGAVLFFCQAPRWKTTIYFGRMTAKALSDRSQEEQGYRETQNGELISYRYAQSLKI